jgi:NADH-quinone oxidoreductase subunit J
MSVAFFILAAIIVCSALGVVASRNPIHSALNLVANLLSVAAIFAMLDAHFLATVQIIVYAGAIVVLVLFVLMLLNLKVEVPTTKTTVLGGVALVTGVIFLAVAVPVIAAVFEAFPQVAAPAAGSEGSVYNVGKLLYTRYVFTFEAASVLIMAAIAGAVMLAKRQYRER